jgi:hypothetical protein
MKVKKGMGLLFALLLGCRTADKDSAIERITIEHVKRMDKGFIFDEIKAVAPPPPVPGQTPTDEQKQWYAVESTTLTNCDFMLYAKKHGISYVEGRRKMGEELLSGSTSFVDDIISFSSDESVSLRNVILTEKAGKKVEFSKDAIRECESYLPAIKNSFWSCAQWFVADYVTYLWKAQASGAPSDEVKKKIKKLPFDLSNIPFMKLNSYTPKISKIDAELQEKISDLAGLAKDDPRVHSVLSNRVFKAYSGMMEAAEAIKELDDLKADAMEFFTNAPFNGQWRGYQDKDFGSNDTVYYCPKLED